jgi:hypothetical protein
MAIGRWPEQCEIEASTFDGSHRRAARSIPELCRAAAGTSDCYRITGADFLLVRTTAERRMSRLAFRPHDNRLELVHHVGSDERPVCSERCDLEVPAGRQRFSLRLASPPRELWSEEVTLSGNREMDAHFVEDTDPEWPSAVGAGFAVAGVGTLLYAAWKRETAPAVVGASSLAVGFSVMVIWMPGMHSAEVRWTPAARARD